MMSATSNLGCVGRAESALQLIIDELCDPTILAQAEALADQFVIDSEDESEAQVPPEENRTLLANTRLLLLTFKHSRHFDAESHTLVEDAAKCLAEYLNTPIAADCRTAGDSAAE